MDTFINKLQTAIPCTDNGTGTPLMYRYQIGTVPVPFFDPGITVPVYGYRTGTVPVRICETADIHVFYPCPQFSATGTVPVRYRYRTGTDL